MLDLIRKRTSVYTRAREYKLLVRLITGTKEYTRLKYLMILLIRHDFFELLLSKHVVIDQVCLGAPTTTNLR